MLLARVQIAWQAEAALADDVALDVRGATRDRDGDRAHHARGPGARRARGERLLLGLGPDVTVVGPPELVDRIRAQATAALDQYAAPAR